MMLQAAAIAFAVAGAAAIVAGRWLRAGLACGCVAAALGVIGALGQRTPLPESFVPAVRENPEYAGSEACRSCHLRQDRTWRASFHRTMTQPASATSILATWTGRVGRGMTAFELRRRGDAFFVDMVDVEGLTREPDKYVHQDAPPRVERRVVQVTGSHHKQIYWYATGRGKELGMLPWLWLIQDRRWVPRNAAFLRPVEVTEQYETGRWNSNCVRCHTTGGRPRVDSENKVAPPATDVVEHGIACEACHGPSARHARDMASPVRRYQRHLGDDAPVAGVAEPESLTPKAANQLCGQCHSPWLFRPSQWPKYAREGPTYKIGDDLHASRNVLTAAMPRESADAKLATSEVKSIFEDLFWADGMVRVGGREYAATVESPCYRAGKPGRALTCLSCHTMHPKRRDERPLTEWADDQLKPGMRGDKACTQCHSEAKWPTEAHTHHAPDTAGSRCMNCHMPHATYTLLKATRNHMVASPNATISAQTGRPNACSLCHLDKPLAWVGAKLHEWYGQPVPTLSDDHERLPSGVVWGLAGNALQRALVAWHMGWLPARAGSGDGWLPAVLLQRLVDPYPAVRYIAERSLRQLPGFATLDYDFIDAEADRGAKAAAAMRAWFAAQHVGADMVLDGRVTLHKADYSRLLRDRDETRVDLPE